MFLIERNNAFFQKREEVFERTRVLTFFHLFLSLSFSLAMYSTRPHRPHDAAEEDDVETIVALITIGANVNETDDSGIRR